MSVSKPLKIFWSLSRDRKKQYRVHGKAKNGKIIWASSEGYSNKWRACHNAAMFGGPGELVLFPCGTILNTVVHVSVR